MGNDGEDHQSHPLRCFHKSGEFKRFSSAVENLSISEIAAIQQITSFEDHLGARLLNRTTRRLSVTNIEAAEWEADQQHSQPTGVLRGSAGMLSRHLQLVPAHSTFLKTHPEINVELVLNDRIVDLVDENHDLALRIAEI
jgi:DNA-binding transcriptional LysR family regulator